MPKIRRKFVGYFVVIIAFRFLYNAYVEGIPTSTIALHPSTSTLKKDAVLYYKPSLTTLQIPHSHELVFSNPPTNASLTKEKTILSIAKKNQTILSQTKNQTILSQTKNQTILSPIKNQTILSQTKNQTILSQTKNQTILSPIKNQTILSQTKNQTILSQIKNQTILSQTKNQTTVTMKQKNIVKKANSNQKADKKIHILFATNFWHHARFPGINAANKLCPRCMFTSKKSTWNQSSAVIFHAENTAESTKIPKRYDPDQIWVIMMFESPKYSNINGELGNMFNWTMSYRKDSDIFAPYGRFHLISSKSRPNLTSEWAFSLGKASKKRGDLLNQYLVTPSAVNFHKRKLSAWISSHCRTQSLREALIEGLKAHIEIDVYGKCGNLTCKIPNKQSSGVDCRLQLQNRYKFYFAFENSLCEDYVTEKFFDVVGLTDMVPVVYGGVEYRKMFPPKSFINVRDFKKVEDLAKYLKYVGSNSTAWLEYFEYRKSYWVQTERFASAYCDLCNKLVQRSSRNPWIERDDWQTYTSVKKWWSAGSNYYNRTVCVEPKTVPIIAQTARLWMAKLKDRILSRKKNTTLVHTKNTTLSHTKNATLAHTKNATLAHTFNKINNNNNVFTVQELRIKTGT